MASIAGNQKGSAVSRAKSATGTPRAITLAFGALVVLLAGWFVLMMFDEGDVGAQAGPSPAACGGDFASSFGSVGFNSVVGDKLQSTSPTSRTFNLSSPIPAGTYSVTAVSYDGYDGRSATQGQTQEQWFGELLSAGGAVLARTTSTGDLADGVEEATWVGGIGQVSLAETATQIRANHSAAGNPAVNSVRPVCIGATLLAPPPTTPPVTEPPATTQPPTTLPAPPTTEEPPATGPSSVTVNKVTSGITDDPATITLDCGAAGSAIGTETGLAVGNLEPGDICQISLDQSATSDVEQISFSVSPNSIIPIIDATSITLEVPTAGLDIVVTVTCTVTGEDIAPETTVAPPATEPPAPTTTTTSPPPPTEPPATDPPRAEPEDQEPEAEAPPAQPVRAEPDFTG